jgi:hypothetical protein
MNIGCYKEAAEHFLSALSLHVINMEKEVKISKTLWETLHRTFVLVFVSDVDGEKRFGRACPQASRHFFVQKRVRVLTNQ